MYAVIETGGKQYRVELGTEIEVDRLDVEPGQTIDFDRVLLVADGDQAAIGRPLVDGARVSAGRRAPDPRRQDRRLQVQAQGAHPRQARPPRGPDRAAHRGHRAGPAAAPPKDAAAAVTSRSRPPPRSRSQGRRRQGRRRRKALAAQARSRRRGDQPLPLRGQGPAAEGRLRKAGPSPAPADAKAAPRRRRAGPAPAGTAGAAADRRCRAEAAADATTDAPKKDE